MLDARLDYELSNWFTLYTFELVAPVFAFSGTPGIMANNRAEVGMHIPGTYGAIDFFVSYEHLFRTIRQFPCRVR